MRHIYNCEITDLYDYSFSGTIEVDNYTLNIFGEFSVSFDNELPIVEINQITALVGKSWKRLNLDRINYDELCYYIESRGDQLLWLSDYDASRSDCYYNLYKDNELLD